MRLEAVCIVLCLPGEWKAVIDALMQSDVEEDNGNKARLVGNMTIPMAIGTVGGATRIHPTAQLSLRMMDVHSANELAEVVTTVGLIQNLGALRALTTDGIVRGHMDLHKANLIAATDATTQEKPVLHRLLQDHLTRTGSITQSDAQRLLDALRGI